MPRLIPPAEKVKVDTTENSQRSSKSFLPKIPQSELREEQIVFSDIK